MIMIYDPIPFVKLIRKMLDGNYEPIMGICGKIFIINLHNLQMLIMLCVKCKFSECLISYVFTFSLPSSAPCETGKTTIDTGCDPALPRDCVDYPADCNLFKNINLLYSQ